MQHTISVSVVFATPKKQWLQTLTVPRGTSAFELVEQSGLLQDVGMLENSQPESLLLGIHSQRVEHDHLLEEGDRVEIYRPLTADPKEVRRQLAKMGKTMGSKNTGSKSADPK